MENLKEFDDEVKLFFDQMDQLTNNDLAVAFSGGVDSCLVLKVACDMGLKKGKKIYAVTIHTSLHPMLETKITKELATKMGAQHHIIYVDELAMAGIENNPQDRCYLCKKYLFEHMKSYVAGFGTDVILDGTNEDDLHIYRPGLKALKELNIISPLAISGMKKDQVRKMANQLHLKSANTPSAPCLATRFPYGTFLNKEDMEKVDQGEIYLREMGFYNVRIRVHQNIARIEIDSKDFMKLVEKKEQIVEKLRGLGYLYVTMDLMGFRSGSMDEGMASSCLRCEHGLDG